VRAVSEVPYIVRAHWMFLAQKRECGVKHGSSLVAKALTLVRLNKSYQLLSAECPN